VGDAGTERRLDLDLKLVARAENVAIVRRALGGLAERLGADPLTIGDLKTAVTEACMNVVLHAYGGRSGPGLLEVEVEAGERRIAVCVRDYGDGLQPKPAKDQEGPRLGIPLMVALSHEFEIRGGPGQGTEVRLAFMLDEPEPIEPSTASAEPELAESEALIAIRSDGAGPFAIKPVATLLAARTDLSVDRVSDVEILCELLADAVAKSGEERPVSVAIREFDVGLELRLGPLSVGAGERLLAGAVVPGLGDVLERLSDEVAVETVAEDAELLRLEIRSR
jgi:anti-sigma regulatory factor (Ser/Thr protein kinase)